MKILAIMALLATTACCKPEAPPPEPAPPSSSAMAFSIKEGPNTPCRITCGSATCVLGYDTWHAFVHNCDSGESDTCVCAD